MKPSHHYNRRFFGAILLTSMLTLLFMGLAVTSGAMAQYGDSSNSGAQSVPAHQTEVEATETHHSGGGGGNPGPGHGSRTPEATQTQNGNSGPGHTRTPEATETEHANETRTPEATETQHGGDVTRTRTPEPEPSETEHPQETRTPGTPGANPTETEHPHETQTAQTTRTSIPSPIPTGQAPATLNQPAAPASVPASVPGSGTRTFAATGKTVNGVFLAYLDGNGGLAQQGYPISAPMQERSTLDGKTYTTQYFERSVFELRPENAAPYNILLSQLGTFRYNQKYPAGAPNQTANKAGGQFFATTGHWVGGAFLAYWQSHGGITQQGYPLSDEFTEISPLDGKPYRVQYFGRAVFEFHPENAAPNNVLLSQLGTFRYKATYQK